MASGISIDETVIKAVEHMKVHKHGDVEEERVKLLMLCISEDEKFVVVDEELTLYVKDVANEENVYKKVMSRFPKNDFRYALYDCCYRTKETSKEDLIFIFWSPDSGPMRRKFIYTSSAAALKMKLVGGIKHRIELHDNADLEISDMIERLGGKGEIVQIEGKETSTQ